MKPTAKSQPRHSHNHSHPHGIKAFIAPAISLIMLIIGIVINHFYSNTSILSGWKEYAWYIAAFLPVGIPVIKEALNGIIARDYFNEFTLMVIACIGAFCIHELPEAVGVMLFYSIGETLQHGAVDRATRNISRLLDIRGEKATVIRNGQPETVVPLSVSVGEIIEVYPGERVPLDGVMIGNNGLLDTSALTGESIPQEITDGNEVLAGMISLQNSIRIKVTRRYEKSALTRILELVKNASSRKSGSELFIRKFARIYTPVVIFLAALLVAVPAIVGLLYPAYDYNFSQWLYRALVFLVISCPCALVISVPLGYFAGIGAASRAGILFKGGNYLDAITRIKTVAFDKTGTLTTGKFSVERVVSGTMENRMMLSLMAAAEAGSTHPLAKALIEYVTDNGIDFPRVHDMIEKPGYGTVAIVNGYKILAGNLKMLKAEGIPYPAELDDLAGTIIVCAVDGKYAGYVVLSDTLKSDAIKAIDNLRDLGIDNIVMLSGDKNEIVKTYAAKIGITEAHGDLLPQDKAEYISTLTAIPNNLVAFIGDGMNDAPVLALSDVGIAMGGLGSDAAIESADVVIQNDQPSRIATAIKIGRATRSIVTQNIVGAIGIKLVILTLGAIGYASLWAAVFADVGVALLAVMNSMRIMLKKY